MAVLRCVLLPLLPAILAQTVLPLGPALSQRLLPGVNYTAPAGGCLLTITLAGGGGSGHFRTPGGGGASFPVVFWAHEGLNVSAVLGQGGTNLGGGGASALFAGGALLAVAGGGGGASGGANNGTAPQTQTAGGAAGLPRSYGLGGGSFLSGGGGGGSGGNQTDAGRATGQVFALSILYAGL